MHYKLIAVSGNHRQRVKIATNYSPIEQVSDFIYEGELNEKIKTVIKIRNTARLSCKLATVILMV